MVTKKSAKKPEKVKNKKQAKRSPLSRRITVTNDQIIVKSRKHQYISVRNVVFLVGMVFAVGLAFGRTMLYGWATNEWLLLLFMTLGAVIGVMHMHKDSQFFLISVVALGLMSVADLRLYNIILTPLGTLLSSFIQYLIFFLAPATLIIAIKEIWYFFKV